MCTVVDLLDTYIYTVGLVLLHECTLLQLCHEFLFLILYCVFTMGYVCPLKFDNFELVWLVCSVPCKPIQ